VKRSFLIVVLLIIASAIFAQKSENITNVQNRLKADGFYSGKPTGLLDDDTSFALRRFQIRHGLSASGRLDAATAKEINASAPQPAPTPPTLNGTWRRLPNGEMQFVEERPATTTAPAAAAGSSVLSSPGSSPPLAPPAEGPPARTAQNSPPSTSPPPTSGAQPPLPSSAKGIENPERLRDYIEAFILAGLAPSPDAEIKFFADSVDYFGAPNIPRQQIQSDLVRYDQKWPHRRFWMDGDIQIQQQGGNAIKLVFPLRYELRNGSRYASGKVMKSLTLFKTANDELQVVAVNEWKAPE
jgi:peptidoglycan hydrolase-like protein with peptidoglycan-binding domain